MGTTIWEKGLHEGRRHIAISICCPRLRFTDSGRFFEVFIREKLYCSFDVEMVISPDDINEHEDVVAAVATLKKDYFLKNPKQWPDITTADFSAWEKAYAKLGMKQVLHKIAKKLKKKKK